MTSSFLTSPVPRPADEPDRLEAVRRAGLEGARPDAVLAGLVRLAGEICGTSSAEINVVGEDEVGFLAAQGLGTPGATVPREQTFCTWTVLDPDRPLLVADAATDERFAANPFVVDGTIASYAGFPLVVEGQPVGSLCVHDHAPRELSAEQIEALAVLARAAQDHLALRRENAELRELSRTDALTGVANRRAIDEVLIREVARAGRGGVPLAVVLLDLDRFKEFNDARGHQAGDILLQDAASAWRAVLRASDLLGRWGGEEFLAVLPDCDADAAAEVAERLRSATPGEQTVSAGVAVWDPPEDPAALVARADAALYAAKGAGRDRMRCAG